MIRHAVLAATLLAPLAAASAAAAPPEHEALFDALEVDRMVALMRAESVAQGEELAEELFPGRGAEAWGMSVEAIYDEGVMLGRFQDAMSAALEGGDVPAMTEFFASERGGRIVELELAAREALSDEDAEEAARATWSLMPEDDPERARRIERFIAVNDLVSENVEAALNANLGFFQGLAEGGALPEPMTQDEMLAQVWSTEAEVRAEMEDWLGTHLALAYEPLSDEDLDAYVAFSETGAGQDLNRALLTGFDAMFEGVGVELGRAAAARMVGFDL